MVIENKLLNREYEIGNLDLEQEKRRAGTVEPALPGEEACASGMGTVTGLRAGAARIRWAELGSSDDELGLAPGRRGCKSSCHCVLLCLVMFLIVLN